MGLDYSAQLTALQTIINNHNTTTASPDLSANLTRRVVNVLADDPEVVSLRGDQYPTVFMWIEKNQPRYDEMAAVVGTQNATRRSTLMFNVLGLIRKDGAPSQHSTALTEVYKLAKNLEDVLQTEYNLSGAALWITPKDIDFIGPVGHGGVWVKAVKISLEAEYLYR